jgi:guanylate kinase
MDNNRQVKRAYHLQKKIMELTQQYYKAIKNNISFENLKIIFIKRKKLEEELTELENRKGNNFDPANSTEKIDSNLNINEAFELR